MFAKLCIISIPRESNVFWHSQSRLVVVEINSRIFILQKYYFSALNTIFM